MADITDTAVYEYPDEVVVEVIGSDEYGEVAAVTYQFSYVDGSPKAVTAEQAIDDAHVELAKEALAEHGYQPTSLESLSDQGASD